MAVAASAPRLYRPRRPERTVLYRALAEEFEHLLAVYEERFEPAHGFFRRAVEKAVPTRWTMPKRRSVPSSSFRRS